MEKVIHKSDTRGIAEFGWLYSRHTFSFGHYFDPNRIQFGALRVLNDDIVEPGKGFGTHPHDNMEIVSIPLSGTLAHKDSTGNEKTIQTGEVQIMSAGTGLTHSEYNYSSTDQVNFLQIWVLPKERDIQPRYDQKFFDFKENEITTVVSPTDENALWINQDAVFSVAKAKAGNSLSYKLTDPSHGIYAFVIEGKVNINGVALDTRDGLGISDVEVLDLQAFENAQVLLIEIPMI